MGIVGPSTCYVYNYRDDINRIGYQLYHKPRTLVWSTALNVGRIPRSESKYFLQTVRKHLVGTTHYYCLASSFDGNKLTPFIVSLLISAGQLPYYRPLTGHTCCRCFFIASGFRIYSTCIVSWCRPYPSQFCCLVIMYPGNGADGSQPISSHENILDSRQPAIDSEETLTL